MHTVPVGPVPAKPVPVGPVPAKPVPVQNLKYIELGPAQ